MNTINPNNMTQIVIVVRDLEKTAKNYCQIFGLEMPDIYTIPPEEITHAKYNNKPTKCTTRLVAFKMDSYVIELIEPDRNHPSVWKDFLDEHGEGIQDITFAVPDFQKTINYLDSEGMPVIHIGEFAPGKFWANVDTREKLGTIINVKDM